MMLTVVKAYSSLLFFCTFASLTSLLAWNECIHLLADDAHECASKRCTAAKAFDFLFIIAAHHPDRPVKIRQRSSQTNLDVEQLEIKLIMAVARTTMP